MNTIKTLYGGIEGYDFEKQLIYRIVWNLFLNLFLNYLANWNFKKLIFAFVYQRKKSLGICDLSSLKSTRSSKI